MSIRATVDGQNYDGIAKINAGGKAITLTEQGTIATPTQTKNIDANGTFDVTNFAQAIVNVPSSSAEVISGTVQGNDGRQMKIVTGKAGITHFEIFREDWDWKVGVLDAAYKVYGVVIDSGHFDLSFGSNYNASSLVACRFEIPNITTDYTDLFSSNLQGIQESIPSFDIKDNGDVLISGLSTNGATARFSDSTYTYVWRAW